MTPHHSDHTTVTTLAKSDNNNITITKYKIQNRKKENKNFGKDHEVRSLSLTKSLNPSKKVR